ncbi:MAG: hypothetical protein KC454_06535 [Flavobacteriales bacterium]|nr:hypothetical protein [Flavobacteriales bacterium]
MKKLLLLTAAIYTFNGVSQTIPDYVPTDELIGWYPFNGNANDESGNGNDGTINSTSLELEKNSINNAVYHFNGVDDNISIDNTADFNFDNTDAFSIQAWIKSDLRGSPGMIISKIKHSAPYTGYEVFTNSLGEIGVYVINDFDAKNYILLSTEEKPLSDKKTHHVIVTYDGTSKASGINIFVDGTLYKHKASSDNLTGSIKNSVSINIGSRNQECCYESALIDDVGFWNKVLSKTEINRLYTSNYYGVKIIVPVVSLNPKLVVKNGISKGAYENSQIKYKYKFKEGKLNGKGQEWYQNGQFKYNFKFNNNIPKGTQSSWYKNGQLAFEGDFKDGFVEGPFNEWYENGQLKSQLNYKDGALDGVQRTWFKNGQLESECGFRDGLKEGFRYAWNENGQKLFQAAYAGSKLSGSSKRWHRNGQLKSEIDYKEGKVDGNSKLWYEVGQLESEGKYINGIPNGSFNEWHENGQLKNKLNYVNGKPEGDQIKWYVNGQIESEFHYKEGKLEDTKRTYYSNGLLHREANFKDGIKNGLEKEFSETGELWKEKSFKDGKLNGIAKLYKHNLIWMEVGYKSGLLGGVSKVYNIYEKYNKAYKNNTEYLNELITEVSYKDDMLDGVFKMYIANQIAFEANFKENKLQGLVNIWHNNGQLSTSDNYSNDKRNGTSTSWHSNGKLEVEANFLNGNIDDDQIIIYDEKGKILQKQIYWAGYLDSCVNCKGVYKFFQPPYKKAIKSLEKEWQELFE